jgi:hypothetical protein
MAENGKTFAPAAFNADPALVRSELARGAESFLKRWGGAYRSASAELASWILGPLPKSAPGRVSLVDLLMSLQTLRSQFLEEARQHSALVGSHWHGLQTEFATLAAAIQWLTTVREVGFNCNLERAISVLKERAVADQLQAQLQALQDNASDGISSLFAELQLDSLAAFGITTTQDVPIANLIDTLRLWQNSIGRYREWVDIAETRATLVQNGLLPWVEAIDRGPTRTRGRSIVVRTSGSPVEYGSPNQSKFGQV